MAGAAWPVLLRQYVRHARRINHQLVTLSEENTPCISTRRYFSACTTLILSTLPPKDVFLGVARCVDPENYSHSRMHTAARKKRFWRALLKNLASLCPPHHYPIILCPLRLHPMPHYWTTFLRAFRPLPATEPCDAKPTPRRELPVVSAHHSFEEWDEDSLGEYRYQCT